jgi:hypothetical protein
MAPREESSSPLRFVVLVLLLTGAILGTVFLVQHLSSGDGLLEFDYEGFD